jgi:hypothetical protein
MTINRRLFENITDVKKQNFAPGSKNDRVILFDKKKTKSIIYKGLGILKLGGKS